ncbi:MAG: hypothetical protein K2K68_08920 [Duncaniella sp.]|nr:hypothetical protein [Duncaniella sp.]
MRKFYYLIAVTILAVGSLLSPVAALAVTETADYSETFDGITDAGAPDFAPAYWLHYVDKGSSTDPWYAAEATGGHDDGAYLRITDKCNPFFMTDDLLATLPVKGQVSFWVKGKTLSLYKMTFDGTKLSKGTSISLPAGFSVNQTEWQKVTIDVADYTRIGILFRQGEGGLDDFHAEFADCDPLVFTSISNISFDSNVVADVDGVAKINVAFSLTNKGTESVDFTDVEFSFGNTNYLGDALTSDLGTFASGVGALAPGEAAQLSFEVPYTLADHAVTESSVTLGVKNGLNGAVTKIGSVKVSSLAGVFTLKNGSTEVKADNYVEAGYHSGEYTLTLSGSNTGESDIIITDAEFDGSLDGHVTFATPFTLAKGATAEAMTFLFDNIPGAKTGNVTFTYSNGINDDCKFTFSLGGATVAEDGWIEDFNSLAANTKLEPGTMPLAGWRVESQYFMANKTGNNVQLNSTQYNTSTIITPMVKIEKGGQLSFLGGRQYVSDSQDKVLIISVSTDRDNWTELGGIVAKAGTGRIPFNTFEAPAKANDMRWYNFSFKNVETGNYYIKFEAAPFSFDNIFGVTPVEPAHDLILESLSAPASGEVNKLFSASVEITNMRATGDDEYVVTLFEGETPVAQSKGVTIDGYGKASVQLSYMPHTAGEATLHAVLDVAEGYKEMTSSDIIVNIAEEECVGKSEMTVDGYKSDVLLGAKFNKVQFYVPADMIDLPAGKEISEIEFSVYNSSSYGQVEMPYSLWIQEVENVTPFGDDKSDFELPDESEATTGTYILGSGTSSASNPTKCIIPLAKALEYTGKDLLITMEMNLTSTTYSFYVGTHNYDSNMCRYYGKNFETGTFPGGKVWQYTPAVTLRYALEAATVSGRVISKGVAQEGANVVLTETEAEDTPAYSRARVQAQVDANASKVAYSGVTDSEGRFSIPVVKNDRAYQLTVESADDTYVHPTTVKPTDHIDLKDLEISDVVTSISSVEASQVMISVSGSALTVAGSEAIVYSVDGKVAGVAHDGEALMLVKGIYIVSLSGTNTATKIVIR